MDARLPHYVGVEDGVDLAIFESDALKIRQGYLATVDIPAPKIPDTKQRDAAETVAYGRVGLANPLRYEKRPIWISQVLSGRRRHIQCHVGTTWGFVLDRFAFSISSGLIRPILVQNKFASHAMNRK